MNDLINQINNKLDIVEIVSEYVPLSKKGKNFWGVCPFHGDSNPSMSVSPEKQIYKCFSCGASGGIVNFYADIKKISFNKALVELGAKIGVIVEDVSTHKYTPQQQKLINIFSDATSYMQYMLTSEEGTIASQYVEKRGLTNRLIERFKIGYAPEKGLKEFLIKKGHDEADLINASLVNSMGNDFFHGRLIFPISNQFGDVVGFSARTLKNEDAKYINSSESSVFHKSSIFYNFTNAQDVAARNKEIFICEGQMDVIALDKSGISNAVAVMGTALTSDHIKLLQGLNIVLNFDSDNAGISATLKSIKLLLENKFKVNVVINELGKDIDEILQTQGSEKVNEIMNVRESALEWVYKRIKSVYSMDNPENIENFVKSFVKYTTTSTDVEKDFYINKISKDFGISNETIKKFFGFKNTYSSQQYIKKEYVPVIENNKTPKTNYSFALIRSMVKKPMLIDLFIEKNHDVHFLDKQLKEISDYLVSYRKNQPTAAKPSLSKKVSEIMEVDQLIANDEFEFTDMIKKVNNDFYDFYINEYKVKLKNESDDDLKNNYLEHLADLKKKKEGK